MTTSKRFLTFEACLRCTKLLELFVPEFLLLFLEEFGSVSLPLLIAIRLT